jgi:hypothetical protein
MKDLYEIYSAGLILNKGGVVPVCTVDLVENRGVEEHQFVSAVEA